MTSIPPLRPDIEYSLDPIEDVAIEQHMGWRVRLGNASWLRKLLIIASLLVIWEAVSRYFANPLLLPGAIETFNAMWQGLLSGELESRIWASLDLLLRGYLIGIVLSLALTSLAIMTRFGRDLLSALTSMFSPLPAIALLPIALLWFGLGSGSVIFVVVHSVLWPMSLNIFTGFQGVSPTLKMVGHNYGLRGIHLVLHILIPAALPSILSGLRIGWAFSWRTLIAAEMVFGASSGQGGLGWYIYQNRNELMTANVFAGLAMVIIIGLLVENLFFSLLERVTVKRWGMTSEQSS